MGTQWRDHLGTGRTKYRTFGMHEAAAAWGPNAFSWRAGPSASIQRRAGGCVGRGGAHDYRPRFRPWWCRGYVAGPPPSNACGPAGPGMAARTVAVRPGNGDPVLGKRRRAGHLPRVLPHITGGSLIQKVCTCQADNRITPLNNRIVIALYCCSSAGVRLALFLPALTPAFASHF